MYMEILDILICPKCQAKLKLESKEHIASEVIEGTLLCAGNHQWKIEGGVINFESEEQENANNWNELYKKMDYEELDIRVKERTPKIEIDAQEKAIEEIIDLINKYQAKKVLDIATGRGILLSQLVKNFKNNIELVCVDLSFEVLKYDRIKCMKINPDARINYIACDATKLPFLRDTFDLSVSFFGVQNMGNLASEGIQEGVRVSSKGLINAGYVIKDDNPEIKSLNELVEQHGYDFKVDSVTESHFHQLHNIDESYRVEVTNVFEGIGEKNENDLIPIEGQWFALAISKTDRV